MTPAQLSAVVFAEMFAIIAACRIVGFLARRRLGQPQVVGEMIAGVVLGPSVLGLLAPGMQAALFPPEARGVLYVGAQFGVGLYMFLVGLGFRADHFRTKARSAAAVSLAGIAAPFAAAILLAPWLLDQHLFGARIDTSRAILFTGAAISITAFPMLARIIHERGLSGTPLGTLSLSAGAINDAGAWMVLAIVLTAFGDGPSQAVATMSGGLVFAAFMLTLGPRLLAPLGQIAEREGRVGSGLLAVSLLLFLVCAGAMDAIGIHAVFGGFLLGAVMPRGVLADGLRRQLEPAAVVVLLPMFFTFSGLNTQLALVDSADLVLLTAATLAVSILAKGGACWLAARLTGQDNATALGIGALMNSRGLMELIIVNIGLQRGVIGPALFAMLVLMAIVTTLMASPLFELVYGRKARARGELGALSEIPPEGDLSQQAVGASALP